MSDIIAKINKKLDQLGKFEPTIKEVIEECYQTINSKLNDGWSFERLAKIISAEGCTISGAVLEQHYNKIHRARIKSEREIKEVKLEQSSIKSTGV